MRDFLRTFFRDWLPGFRYVLLAGAVAAGAAAAVLVAVGIGASAPYAGLVAGLLWGLIALVLLTAKSWIDAWLQRGDG